MRIRMEYTGTYLKMSNTCDEACPKEKSELAIGSHHHRQSVLMSAWHFGYI